jgi:hypothetical protein
MFVSSAGSERGKWMVHLEREFGDILTLFRDVLRSHSNQLTGYNGGTYDKCQLGGIFRIAPSR